MENPNVELLNAISKCENDTNYRGLLKEELSKGLSYVTATATVLSKLYKNDFPSIEEFLSTPNNMLALEYAKAMNYYKLNWEYYPIARENDYNSESLDGKFASATAIRLAIANNTNYSAFVPDNSAYTGKKSPNVNLFNSIALFSLRTKNNMINLSDAGEGLENKLYKNALSSSSLYEAQEKTKSKRYTFARIKRLTLDNLLSIQKDDVIFPDNATSILLGVKKDFIPYLKDFSPYLVTENSQLDKFIPQNFIKIEELAEQLYSTLCSEPYNGIIKKLVKV
jgi:predicted nucleotidyltransferase